MHFEHRHKVYIANMLAVSCLRSHRVDTEQSYHLFEVLFLCT